VKPFELLGESRAPDGTALKLVRRDTEYLILADDKPLMSSRQHGSEEALASAACCTPRTLKHPVVLIGGLGMGFTLRAALEILPPQATIVVAELVPAVVEWNRGPLGELAAHPLKDERVRVKIEDVAETLKSQPSKFDVVLLDVDNGPAAFTSSNNAGLYNAVGIVTTFRSLKPGGVLAVWSAREDKNFAQRLAQVGFVVEIQRIAARGRSSGARHTIYVCHKSPTPNNR
jgi:spermidine synthase